MPGPIETIRNAGEAIELAELLLRLTAAIENRNTVTETLTRGLSANGVLFAGIVTTTASAAGSIGRRHSEVPYASLIVSDAQAVGPIIVSNDDPSGLAVAAGAGVWEVAKGGREIIPLTGRDVVLWTPGTSASSGINLAVLSIPPYRVVGLA